MAECESLLVLFLSSLYWILPRYFICTFFFPPGALFGGAQRGENDQFTYVHIHKWSGILEEKIKDERKREAKRNKSVKPNIYFIRLFLRTALLRHIGIMPNDLRLPTQRLGLRGSRHRTSYYIPFNSICITNFVYTVSYSLIRVASKSLGFISTHAFYNIIVQLLAHVCAMPVCVPYIKPVRIPHDIIMHKYVCHDCAIIWNTNHRALHTRTSAQILLYEYSKP